jgi:Ser/Thr protein kinase RdoA (MazF antagonist)
LHRSGIPVAVPILNQTGSASVLFQGNRFTLSPFLAAGRSWLELDPEGLWRLNYHCGEAIGHLHIALAAFPQAGLEQRTWRTEVPGPWFEQYIPAIREQLIAPQREAFDALLHAIQVEMEAATRELPEQLIHRDCHHGNIVVHGEQVTGFVDCDHLSLGPRVFDLADFLIHMIKHEVNEPHRTAEWFRLFPAVLQGYKQANPLGEQEKRAVYWMMLGVLILFVDWFYKTGNPEKARADLKAFLWMAQNRLQIQDRMKAALR